MHPSARILLYLFSALAVPGLSFFALGCLVGFALVTARRRLAALASLFWRTRWLFLLLFLGNGYNLPGEPVLTTLGTYAPTWEGLAQGLNHCLRLLTILLLLDVLVLALPRGPQLAGLYGVLRPLAFLGIDAGRTAVRLDLTLQAMERPLAERGRLRELLIDSGGDAAETSQYELPIIRWRSRDVWLLILATALLVVLWRYA
jgi:energy-coupling factor transporter transmembrane protein EcfT